MNFPILFVKDKDTYISGKNTFLKISWMEKLMKLKSITK